MVLFAYFFIFNKVKERVENRRISSVTTASNLLTDILLHTLTYTNEEQLRENYVTLRPDRSFTGHMFTIDRS